ncbi:uncharacterized protein AB675_5944 [Cyphellophora attinorum]|uniref:NADH:ubiquinone oxidoreductase intermediate-associated protein 30 domain-containing protein n=1 Tax=Cyphellophora attinorum TaxID=1664694 RepID=A0A0N0NL61_9EURO|nr:uncharacterized protein AB675_5944 [Phialophora attinorum]KPI38808.1 hypothetical protein AB675_5944 [Phialophora attinorum]
MAVLNGNYRSLYGGELTWSEEDWISSDDRVRGGHSKSHLRCEDGQALFCGHLDTKTLGGAGFASQRTAGELKLNLSEYDGIELIVDHQASDEKKYTFILKDDLLPERDDGREQSTVSWEYDFVAAASAARANGLAKHQTVFIPWHSFTATYRGKPMRDAGRPNVASIKRIIINDAKVQS